MSTVSNGISSQVNFLKISCLVHKIFLGGTDKKMIPFKAGFFFRYKPPKLALKNRKQTLLAGIL
jgi:hypothetical protein